MDFCVKLLKYVFSIPGPLITRACMNLAIECRNLSKHYGAVIAVRKLDLEIPKGCFFGLLGPNGSGKTTTIHMLSTLIRPSSGRAKVAGTDVVEDPVGVRRAVGLVFQESALDRNLTVAENLRFAGALYGLADPLLAQRSEELLELFDLKSKRDAPVATLSGGMRRALDIARGVLHKPRVLFLDEPTIGLDPINRRAIWRFIGNLRQEHGMTVLLTTHYLEEAEPCDAVAFMRTGEIIGSGSPGSLIAQLGEYVLEIESDNPAEHAARLIPTLGPPVWEGEHLLFAIPDRDFPIARLQQELKSRVRTLHLRKPDLNDVYLWHNNPPAERPRDRARA